MNNKILEKLRDQIDLEPDETMKKILLETFILGTQHKGIIYNTCGYCDGENFYNDGECPACVDGFSGL